MDDSELLHAIHGHTSTLLAKVENVEEDVTGLKSTATRNATRIQDHEVWLTRHEGDIAVIKEKQGSLTAAISELTKVVYEIRDAVRVPTGEHYLTAGEVLWVRNRMADEEMVEEQAPSIAVMNRANWIAIGGLILTLIIITDIILRWFDLI